MQYGPYTPQECKKAIDWLQKRHIQFEIVKDQDKENEFRSNNGTNILKQVEFRTETFLAQLFYIEILETSEIVNQEFHNQFSAHSEIFPNSLIEKSETDDLSADIAKSIKTRRFWSWVLIIIWSLFFVGYYFYY